MSLGTKIILLFMSLLLMHGIFNYGIRMVVEEPAYSDVEEEMILRELKWFLSTVEHEVSEIAILCEEFATEQRVANFLKSPNNTTTLENLGCKSAKTFDLNIMILLDSSNTVVFSHMLDSSNSPIKIDGFSADKWAQGHPMIGFDNPDTLKSGILRVRDSLVFGASKQVVENDNIIGTVIAGRLVSPEYLATLTASQQIDAKIVSADQAGFREGVNLNNNPFYIEEINSSNYLALLAIDDIAGKRSLAIKTNMPSNIALKGKRASNIKLISELVFALASLMIMLFLLYRIMGRRLEKLIDHIISIRHSGVLVKIMQESSGDEIDLLGYEFNQMVTRIQQDIELRNQVEIDLKRSLAELQRFADVASHDLQEPLRSVASCVQLLELQYKDNLDDQGKQLIEYAVQGSRRMKTLIKALLAYSSIGNTKVDISTCDCNAVIKEALGELKKLIDDSGTKITYDQLPVVQADKFRLLLLFTNIIHNAIKYTVPGKTPEINISCEKVDKTWRFAITDNGIGIEKNYYTQIFVAFKRLHTQEEHEGSGIGLAICKRIIEQHHGKIWVKSEPGKGSTFYFSIPAA